MAKMMGVSLRTIENRFAEYNLTNVGRFSDIDDASLDIYVEHIVAHFPRSGNKYIFNHSKIHKKILVKLIV